MQTAYVTAMCDDFDKCQWQAEQAKIDATQKQREKDRKSRARAARKAKRKLDRLKSTLQESDDLSDWEDAFTTSVTARLETYGSAFHDLEKGRSGEALSFAQKKIVSSLNRKAKDLKKTQKSSHKLKTDSDIQSGGHTSTGFKSYSSFKSKNRSKFTPRVRHIEDDMPEDDTQSFAETRPSKSENAKSENAKAEDAKSGDTRSGRKSVKPFLRLVKSEKDPKLKR